MRRTTSRTIPSASRVSCPPAADARDAALLRHALRGAARVRIQVGADHGFRGRGVQCHRVAVVLDQVAHVVADIRALLHLLRATGRGAA